MMIRVYAAQPREGTETPDEHPHNDDYKVPGLCSPTPRGDGNSCMQNDSLSVLLGFWFMQLNPARGRKHVREIAICRLRPDGLCSSTPRGDGNTPESHIGVIVVYLGLCSSTPRGDGNVAWLAVKVAAGFATGLCSSTPRGDGNQYHDAKSSNSCGLVYAAQPREGTETRLSRARSRWSPSRFMQLNPARGRKPIESYIWAEQVLVPRFMQLNPARGRKLNGKIDNGRCPLFKVYAAQPREGTETRRSPDSNRGYHRSWFMQLNPARGRKRC